MELIEIQWSTSNLDEARRICRHLVQEKIAAKAQIIPWVESIFLLNNRLDTLQESKVSIISLMDHFDKIKDLITQNSTYDIPEITFNKIDGANPSYSSWLQETLSVNNL